MPDTWRIGYGADDEVTLVPRRRRAGAGAAALAAMSSGRPLGVWALHVSTVYSVVSETLLLTSALGATERMVPSSMTVPSSPVHALVALYSAQLHGVRFGGIDAESLGNLATEVDRLNTDVEAREAELQSLREALAQKEETLLTLAQQALAYAKIYAESDEALSAQLNEIALPRGTKSRKGPSSKAGSERGARAGKDPSDSTADASDAEVIVPDAPAEVAKPRRKASLVEAEEPAAPAAKGGRRKVSTRSGRAGR